MLNYIKSEGRKQYIVATETGILYEMKKNNLGVEFIVVPSGNGCGCADCGYMKQNTLEKLYDCLKNETPEINLPQQLMEDARRPIVRMLDMSRVLGIIK